MERNVFCITIMMLSNFAQLDGNTCKAGATFKRGLINYWPIDGNTSDYFGTAHMYNLTNAELTTDRFGRENSAIRFKIGYAQVPEGVYFAGEFSVTVWVKAYENGAWSRVLDFGNGESKDIVLLTYSKESTLQLLLQLHLDGGGGEIGYNNPIRLNEWIHIAVTKSSTEFRLYINGTLENSISSFALPRNITRKYCYFGKSNWNSDSLANADLDDIKIFNIALNDSDVQFHFKSNAVVSV